ncbi:RNA polymerase sigma factor [Nonomuraea basaltis]|uniref:RNA polymerase sigma factor n=1 Tax=Nonomuraea basaltis TaxID=2495887 RepID=UPI00110C688D|nr:sigma-70 family RNA polymerase sigma factor [Nonomuraea basaltis]TMR92905.1 hypothetical protein EJK15_42090 [Nonomuraea basaltis]
MSQSLTDQRSRAETAAELYDRHAAGLFAYCADQLGDLGAASDVLASVLAGVPPVEPPRAAIYAFARRQIHRRDVVSAPPAVDPLIDPATALVERTLRELRPHQREVLVLSAVCGLSKAELAWVLDVAPDTAEEMAVGAAHRFRHALQAALASTGVRVPKPIADVYGALSVAPLRDVLGRLPWPQPPGALRIHFAGSRSATPGPLFVKPRWPSPPVWPQPLSDADPATSTVIFPSELLTPPPRSHVGTHEATTAPMPKVRGPVGMPLRDPLAALHSVRPVKPTSGEDPSAERSFFMAAPEEGQEPFATGDVLLPKDSPEPFATGDVILPGETPPQPYAGGDVLSPGDDARPFRGQRRRPRDVRQPPPSLVGDILVHKGPADPPEPEEPDETVRAAAPQRTEDPVRKTAPLFQPRPKPAEPVYRMPQPWEDPPGLEKEPPVRQSSFLDPRPVRARPVPKRRPEQFRPAQARRRGNRHFDWAWELIGFLICVAIAMIVFFSVPMFVD